MIDPDVVQVFNVWDNSSLIAAEYCREKKKSFFTESHIHASVLRKSNRRGWREIIPSILNNFRPSIRLINDQTIFCYPISTDAAQICVDVLKVPIEKIKIQSLGVDTDLFFPLDRESNYKKIELRNKLNIPQENLICIYTGRFSSDKSPQVLADAIDILHNKGITNVSGLFVGNGSVDEINYIKSKRGCIVHPFVLVSELPDFYRASDIGVWPREESTSQLDAAACGLPIIISDKVKVIERAEGNGLLFKEGNSGDLAEKILLLTNKKKREEYSRNGVLKVKNNYSWSAIADERLIDYYNSFNKFI